jgi:hypothetical protein
LSARGCASALGLLLSLLGCTAFPVIESGVCGNGVIEKGEDCDTFAEPGQSCRRPGEVGECHFDCRPNADGKRPECPDEPQQMGCVPDGLCHFPTGGFDKPVNFASGVSSWLSTADFDGDGRLDVISTESANELSQARFRIHYFDADAELEETRTFPRVVTRPIARKLTGDDAADDLIFSNDLIGMVPGRADREWIPATFSSYVLPGEHLRAVPVRADGVGEAIGLAIFSVLDEGPGIYVPSLDDAKLSLRAPLSRPFEDLAGEPRSAELMTTRDSPCSEVVYAFLGDDVVHVLDFCELSTDPLGDEVLWRASAREYLVHLPARFKVRTAPQAADIDGDGRLDVLVGAADGTTEGTFVAHGDGATLEDEASRLMLVSGDEDTVGDIFSLPPPLAVGDFTGDGIVDFVEPIGTLSSHKSLVDGQVRYITSYGNRSKPWSMAVVADLNANGWRDVIAGTQGSPGLSLLSGNAGPYPVQTHLNTQGPVAFLTTGDFDGDRIIDTAYVQSGPPRSHSDTLAIAFGQRDGVPLPGSRVAGVVDVKQLGSADQAGLDSVFVISQDELNAVTRSKFTLFDGSPDRLPFASYSLVTFSVDQNLHDSLAGVLAVGAFTAPGANDVFALGGEDKKPTVWSMWLVPDIGGGEEPPRRLTVDTVPSDAYPLTLNAEGGEMSATAVAADLDNDGSDEALLLMQKGMYGTEGCYLLIYDIDGAANTATSKGALTFDVSCRTPELSVADLDRDGHLDLLALIGDRQVAPRQLRLLFNDGKGGFSLERSTVLGVEQHDIRGFSVFNTPPMRIAFVTDDALYVAQNTRSAGTFDRVARVQDFNDASSVVVTDPSGNGIEDLAVADAAGLWLVGAQFR